MSSLTLKRESKQLDFLRLKNIFWGNKALVDMIQGWATSRCQKGGERISLSLLNICKMVMLT